MSNLLQTVESVTKELITRGYEATFEFPGFIDVRIDGACISFGTANETWDGDVEASYDAGVLHTDVPSDCEDVPRIVDALAMQIEACKRTYPHLSYTARQVLGAVMDAMQDAEEIWGPQDYIPLMEAIVAEATLRMAAYASKGGQ